MTGGAVRELSSAEKIGAGVGAGVLSSIVGSPMELIMVQQQVKGTGLLETAWNVVKGGPLLARGSIGMMAREGICARARRTLETPSDKARTSPAVAASSR